MRIYRTMAGVLKNIHILKMLIEDGSQEESNGDQHSLNRVFHTGRQPKMKNRYDSQYPSAVMTKTAKVAFLARLLGVKQKISQLSDMDDESATVGKNTSVPAINKNIFGLSPVKPLRIYDESQAVFNFMTRDRYVSFSEAYHVCCRSSIQMIQETLHQNLDSKIKNALHVDCKKEGQPTVLRFPTIFATHDITQAIVQTKTVKDTFDKTLHSADKGFITCLCTLMPLVHASGKVAMTYKQTNGLLSSRGDKPAALQMDTRQKTDAQDFIVRNAQLRAEAALRQQVLATSKVYSKARGYIQTMLLMNVYVKSKCMEIRTAAPYKQLNCAAAKTLHCVRAPSYPLDVKALLEKQNRWAYILSIDTLFGMIYYATIRRMQDMKQSGYSPGKAGLLSVSGLGRWMLPIATNRFVRDFKQDKSDIWLKEKKRIYNFMGLMPVQNLCTKAFCSGP